MEELLPELKKSFTYSEMQEFIRQLNAIRINGEPVIHASEGNWKMNGLYVTIDSARMVAHIFLPLVSDK